MKKIFVNPIKVIIILLSLVSFSSSLHAQDDNQENYRNHNAVFKTLEDFENEFERLSVELKQEVGFSLEKAVSVKDILVDYYKNIREAYNEYREEKNDETSDVVGSDDSETNIDIKTFGEDIDLFEVESKPQLKKEFKEADKEADEKIVDLLSEDQVVKYVNVKDEWWMEVKDVVFTPYHDKSQGKFDKEKDSY